jgi:hypothetical protein
MLVLNANVANDFDQLDVVWQYTATESNEMLGKGP